MQSTREQRRRRKATATATATAAAAAKIIITTTTTTTITRKSVKNDIHRSIDLIERISLSKRVHAEQLAALFARHKYVYINNTAITLNSLMPNSDAYH
jgi:hypothetical protein